MTKDSFMFYAGLVLALLLHACSTSMEAPQQRHKNLAYLYNWSETYLHPEYQVYNEISDSSVVFVRFPLSDFLYKKIDGKKRTAYVGIKYILYQSLTNGGVIDSSSFIIPVEFNAGKDLYRILQFKVKTSKLSKSFLKVTFQDMLAERKRSDYISIEKTGSFNRQSVFIREKVSQEPVFGNELLVGKEYEFDMSLSNPRELIIRKSNAIEKIALVPYSKQRYAKIEPIIDTTYLASDNILQIKQKGNTLLTFDSTRSRGVLFLAIDSTYNYLHMPFQMIKPLSYLLSPNEYKGFLQSENKKLALDQFWLKVGGNTRVATEMIKVYYYRVSVANKYFTSYKEGWQTDRGMIYIIFGEPYSIYKSESVERWIYGASSSDQSLSFDFTQKYHPHTNKNYVLQRNDSYQKIWIQAIDSWRNGRIFSIAK